MITDALSVIGLNFVNVWCTAIYNSYIISPISVYRTYICAMRRKVAMTFNVYTDKTFEVLYDDLFRDSRL